MTTLKIYETRLVRVPYSHFYGAKNSKEWGEWVIQFSHDLSKKFGPNWSVIGPSYDMNNIENCVELHYQRIFEVPV